MKQSESWWWEKQWGDFRKGSTTIEINWTGGTAGAVLYDVGAPATAAAIRSTLPLEVRVVHVAWSGEMCMGVERYSFGPREPENQVRLVRPGDLTWDPKFDELGFVYGTAECKLPSGPNSVVVYGSVNKNLEQFAQFSRARRFEGLGTLRMSLVGESEEGRRDG
jgi:hypothetical protein